MKPASLCGCIGLFLLQACGDGGFLFIDPPGYGAVAINRTTRDAAIAANYSSQGKANAAVLGKCKGTCEVVMEFGPELCGALAAGVDGAMGWAAAEAESSAEQNALDFCKKNNGLMCTLKLSGCNT
jgi:hypothetical protein